MSNYLFQNISNIFGAPQQVLDIISQFQPIEEPTAGAVSKASVDDLNQSINPETGEVEIPNDQVIGTAADLFGEKIYSQDEDGSFKEQIQDAFKKAESVKDTRSAFDEFKESFKDETVKGIIDIAKEKYGSDLRTSETREIERNLNNQFERAAEKVYSNYEIEQKIADAEHLAELQARYETGRTEEEINAEFEEKKQKLTADLKNELTSAVSEFIEKGTTDVVRNAESKIKEHEKGAIEDAIRNHLRGFSRTIPSFLMAYGDDSVTLASFDQIIPDNVFIEVTSISLAQFCFLRDGGPYTDEITGEEKNFPGNMFDPVVFDDSVKEFLRLRKLLSDWFSEKNTEDIFDYIPPQKTNQIFTPKVTVQKMVDFLEEENPGCFDDPDKTFIDLYMKSGLYITEIVKRLYRSSRMKQLYPDSEDRLRHIFEKQVYGLAPTEIIYRIALSYILGFDEEIGEITHNFRQIDALPYAKAGKLHEMLSEVFA